MTIKVTNANDNAPAITAGQAFDIDDGYAATSSAALESSDPDDINQLGFTTFSGWAIVGGNTGSVFTVCAATASSKSRVRCRSTGARPAYTLVATVSDGANTSARAGGTVIIPTRVDVCLANIIQLEVPKASAPLAACWAARSRRLPQMLRNDR